MNNLLIKLATGLRCFYDTLTLVDYEKDKLNKEIEEYRNEINLQYIAWSWDIKLSEYFIVKGYAEGVFIDFHEVQGFIMMFCKKPYLLGRYGIPKEHCVNRN